MADGKIIVNGQTPARDAIVFGPSSGQTTQAGFSIAIGYASGASLFDKRPVAPGDAPSCTTPEIKEIALGSGHDYEVGPSPHYTTTVLGKRVIVAGLDIRKLAEQVDALQSAHARSMASMAAELRQLGERIEKVAKYRTEQHAAINGRLEQVDIQLRKIAGGFV